MNKEEAGGGGDATLDDLQQAQIAEREAIRLRIMLHGGDPAHSPRLPNLGGRTKREQLRDALEELPYVSEVVFARDPALEADLFDACDGTVILLEPNLEQRGAWYELAMHASQPGAPRKLAVFVPEGDRELSGDGFLPTLVRRRVKSVHQWRYSDDDYEQCYLVREARAFVEGLLIEKSEEPS